VALALRRSHWKANSHSKKEVIVSNGFENFRGRDTEGFPKKRRIPLKVGEMHFRDGSPRVVTLN